MTISLVLFDVHDVLYRYDRDWRVADLARLSGRLANDVYAAIWGSGFEAAGDAGELDGADYLRGFGERLGYPITLEEWVENRRGALTPMDDTLALMAEVKRAVPVAALTNNHTLVRDHVAAMFPALFALCGDAFYVSAQFKAAKPSVAAYELCVAAAGVAPEEVLFIDDARTNVDGALSAGLQAIPFTGAEALRRSLVAAGVLER